MSRKKEENFCKINVLFETINEFRKSLLKSLEKGI
jgi:hypothetical protein